MASEVSEHVLVPSQQAGSTNSQDWPLLLKGYDKMNVRSNHYTPIPAGSTPSNRKLTDYIKYAALNLDKPPRPSSHEVVTWVKNIIKELGVEKTGHSGTLDPKVSGNLLITVDRATRLVKSQQNAGKEYICIIRFHNDVSRDLVVKKLRQLEGPVFQRPPILSAVQRRLRVRTIHQAKLTEWNEKRNLGILHIRCQAGTYIRTLCIHLGLLCGVGAHMQELRRMKTGHLGERDNMVSMHDVRDAMFVYSTTGDESYLRRVFMPCEVLLTHLKRVVMKDSAVNAICFGAKIMIPGLLRFDDGIDIGDEVVIVSTKGEAVCLAHAQMTTNQMSTVDHGVVAKIKRVIMDRETYPRRWGLGTFAMQKKELKKQGKLDKYGMANEQTPKEWINKHPDYGKIDYAVKEPADPMFARKPQESSAKSDEEEKKDSTSSSSMNAVGDSGVSSAMKSRKRKLRELQETEDHTVDSGDDSDEPQTSSVSKKRAKVDSAASSSSKKESSASPGSSDDDESDESERKRKKKAKKEKKKKRKKSEADSSTKKKKKKSKKKAKELD